jgi:AhpC/TSA family
MRDRYSIVVGLIFLAVIVVASLNMLGGGGEGETLGLDHLPDRWPLPEFAVPEAAAPKLEGDANVAQDDCESSGIPCPPDSQRMPACRVDLKEAIRVCDFFDRPLVISFWFSKGSSQCVEQQDLVERVYRRYRGQVGFLSLNIRDDRDPLRELISQREWTMPVGYDRDGAVASLYGIGLCPTFAYVYPGGTLQSASIGELSERQLADRVDQLLEATAAAERS